jgi:uncharacterized protein (DUF924 family)
MPIGLSPAAVLEFWRAAGHDRWFRADPTFDQEVRERFASAHAAATAGALSEWEKSADGALALVIVLDQFSRNMFRGSARAYAADLQAREVARRAIARGFDRDVDRALRTFFYLPFMHSENLDDQEYALALYRSAGDAEGIEYAEMHHEVIRRFGRFPHRNEILGRVSSAEEIAYLRSGGFRG